MQFFPGRLPHPDFTSFCCLVTQSCPTLCDPMDCSPPGSSVHGIFQARILEWVVISFSRGLPKPGIKTAPLTSPSLTADSLPLSHLGGPSPSYASEEKVPLHFASFDPICKMYTDFLIRVTTAAILCVFFKYFASKETLTEADLNA